MTEYIAEFEYGNINKNDFSFSVDANNFEEAAINVVEALKAKGIITENSMIGRIKNPEGEHYEIFRKDWLINTKTGKKLDSLEEKLNQNR